MGTDAMKICWNCHEELETIESSLTGNSYCTNCLARQISSMDRAKIESVVEAMHQAREGGEKRRMP